MLTELGLYTINLLSIFLALCGVGGILISIYLYQYKKSPGISYIALFQFFTALWAVFYCLEYSSTDLVSKLFWSKLSYIGIAFAPIWLYFFSCQLFQRDKIIHPISKAILITIAAFIFIGVMTNDSHHLHWIDAYIDVNNNTTIYQYGPFFWITFLFFYSLLTFSLYNLIKLIKNSANQFRSSLWYILAACIFPVAGNLMYVFKINPIPGFDWTPASFLLTGGIMAYINIHFGAFDVIPFARNKLFDVMEDAMYVTDNHMRIIDFNQSLLTLINKKPDELVGKRLFDIFPNRKEIIEKVSHTDDPFQFTLITEVTPTPRHLDAQVTPLFDKKQELAGRLFVFRDVTKQTQFAEQLVEANNELKNEIIENEKLIADLDAFAHTVAHDLRDTIGAIAASTELVEIDIHNQDYQSATETNKLMGDAANKTLYIIRELLTMATIRQQDVRLERVDMGKVVEESEKRLKDLIHSSQATIIKPEKWPTAMGNPSWLEEVFVNYINNAIKYGGAPPVVELGAEQLYAENKVKFWVKDNGNGLSKSDQDKIFKKYTRLEASRVQGTGLGLSIVKRIVEKLGGEVGVFSNAIPNEGCLFYFILPAH